MPNLRLDLCERTGPIKRPETELPIGTRIIFLKELSDGPDEYSPGNLYAEKGDGGEVTGHGCREGHWVKWDKWKAPFGAVLGKDFRKVDK